MSTLVTAVVVSFNTRDDTLRCLHSLTQQTPSPPAVIVVDNASGDGSLDAVRSAFPQALSLALDANLGFAAANNRALPHIATPFVLLVNSDAELRPNAVDTLREHLEANPTLALVGPRTLNSDGTPQISWGPHLTPLSEWRLRRFRRAVARGEPQALARLERVAREPREPDWLSGSCLLARTERLRAIGGFDERFFLYEEDVDLCLRLRRAGWRLAFVPEAEVVHHQGRSMAGASEAAQLAYHRSHLRYYALHNGTLRTAALRVWLLARAAIGWLAVQQVPQDRPLGRKYWRKVAQLALRNPLAHI